MITGWETAKDVAETFYYIFAAAAAIGAFVVYLGNSMRKRARWVASLFEKFYERDRYKEIRDLLDIGCTAHSKCQACELARESHPQNMRFSDYLNFFELVGFLEKSKQLKSSDIRRPFLLLFGLP